jgi:branched-chain amino acid transport system permease protein
MGKTPVFIGDAYVSRKVVIGFSVAAAVIAVFLLAFRFWRGGIALRATASDQAAAYSCGINVPAVFSIAWMFAGAAAAGAGILVGAVGGIAPTMGVFGLSALVVVIVGGLDSIAGALIGGILVGLLEAWCGTYLGGEYKMLATFGLLMLVLLVRPYGLFGTVEIERL